MRSMFGLNGRQWFLLLLLVVALFAGAQFIPAYFHAFQFNDLVKQEVKFAAASRRTTDDIRTRIASQAKDFDIDIAEKDIRITRRGPAFTVQVDYSIPVNLRVCRRDLNFHVSETGEAFER